MASDLRVRVGNVTAMISLNGPDGQFSDAQVAAVLTRFANSLGIPISGTAQENLTAVLLHIKDDVRRRAKAVDVAERKAVSDAEIETEANAENNL